MADFFRQFNKIFLIANKKYCCNFYFKKSQYFKKYASYEKESAIKNFIFEGEK